VTDDREKTSVAMPLLSDFAPQGAVYDGLMKTLQDGTFVHAYLITGLSGMGKKTLAKRIAQYLMCTGEHKPCGQCPGCMQVMDDNHPDVMTVTPEKGKSTIVVDTMREVIKAVGEHAYEGGNRVVIIPQAEKMNPASQNCLLKTLEEPVPGVVFLLIAEAPEQLLPTIISRCRGLKLHPWDDQVIRRVLQEHQVPAERCEEAIRVSGGSIGKALTVAEDEAYWQRRASVMQDFFALQGRSDILRVSNQWKDRKDDAAELLDDVEDVIRTLLMVRLGRLPASAVSDLPDNWQRMAKEAPYENFSALIDAVWQARKMRLSQVNWQAVVEKLLFSLMEESVRW
jgi:DNA polymerase III subunit delta'